MLLPSRARSGRAASGQIGSSLQQFELQVNNRMPKLQMLVQKAKTPVRIEWVFQLAFDYSYLMNDAFSVCALEGKIPSANGRGMN